MLFHLDKNPPNGLQPQPARRSATRVSLSLPSLYLQPSSSFLLSIFSSLSASIWSRPINWRTDSFLLFAAIQHFIFLFFLLFDF